MSASSLSLGSISFFGAPGWDRTSNPCLRRAVLYPLSYGRISAEGVAARGAAAPSETESIPGFAYRVHRGPLDTAVPLAIASTTAPAHSFRTSPKRPRSASIPLKTPKTRNRSNPINPRPTTSPGKRLPLAPSTPLAAAKTLRL